jgi:predicted nucleotidyltransferase component of viral defense system
MDFSEIRRLVIIAMFSDDTLFNRLALKGGNALNLIYGFGMRSSLDVDLSLEKDFDNPEDSGKRIVQSLSSRFAEAGLTVFDAKFGKRPVKENLDDEKWGGYEVEFKLMKTAKYNDLKRDMGRVRRESLVIGDGQQRIFRVQISKHEYCKGKVEHNLEEYSIYVYTPEMIVIEKLRAICQQMSEYPQRRYATARARDFYDIFSTVKAAHIDLSRSENLELVQHIFAAKSVPLSLLSKIKDYREFHRPDWASVELTAAGKLEEFDFYFDFVIQQAQLLKSLWEI